MVTFRFYVVSVVAFFLALAVGVVLGSALDGRISDSLKDRLERVEANLDSTVDVIDQKNDQIDALNKYADASLPFAVEGRLDSTATLIVAQHGISGSQLSDLVAAIRQAGGSTPGVVWTDKSWDPSSATFRSRVDKALRPDSGRISADVVEETIWRTVLDGLGAPGSEPDVSPTTTTAGDPDGVSTDTSTTTEPSVTPDSTGAGSVASSIPADQGSSAGVAPTTTTLLGPSTWWEQPALASMAQNSILSLQSIGDARPDAVKSLNVVVVTGQDSNAAKGGDGLAALVVESQRRGIPVVMAHMNSSSSENNSKDSSLQSLIDSTRGIEVSSVQGAESVAGRIAVVVALQQAPSGITGRYGTGPLADSLLPPSKPADDGS